MFECGKPSGTEPAVFYASGRVDGVSRCSIVWRDLGPTISGPGQMCPFDSGMTEYWVLTPIHLTSSETEFEVPTSALSTLSMWL